MQPNPFEPPSELADLGALRPTSSESFGKVMYVPNHVGLAAFLGSPLAGAWIIGANYATLERHADRTKALAFGVVGTVALFALAAALPQGTSGSFVSVVYALGLRELTKHLQGKDIDRVLSTGGTKHSAWRAAGIGLLWLALVVGCIVVYLLLTGE